MGLRASPQDSVGNYSLTPHECLTAGSIKEFVPSNMGHLLSEGVRNLVHSYW